MKCVPIDSAFFKILIAPVATRWMQGFLKSCYLPVGPAGYAIHMFCFISISFFQMFMSILFLSNQELY